LPLRREETKISLRGGGEWKSTARAQVGSNNMPLRGLIFDVDGVLVDTVPLHYAAWERMFREFGYPFDLRIYRERVDGKSRLDGVRGVMSDASEQQIAEAARLKQSYYLEQLETARLEPFPDTVRFLRRLNGRGLRLAAASSSVNAPLVLSKIGLLDEMESVVTGADISRGKPDPEIFLIASERLALAPSDCVVLEDAEVGVEAAVRGGFACLAVDRSGTADLLEAADLVVTTLDEVGLTTLEGLTSGGS
jgi:beta-phosphoglucomutase